jgi:DNA-binding NtrC family response regulator
LIVEDERVARRALASLLDRSGFVAHAHESAEDALRDIDEGCDARIALVDIDLPGMSGLDLIQCLEEKKPDLMAIVISAAGGERVDRFRREHRVHYFRKPVDFSRLLGLLESTATQHPPC